MQPLIEKLEAEKHSVIMCQRHVSHNRAIDRAIALVRAHQAEHPGDGGLIEALESLKIVLKEGDSDDALRYAATRNSVLNEAIAVARQDRFQPSGQVVKAVERPVDYACLVEGLSVSRELLKEWFPEPDTHQKVLGMISLLQRNAEDAVENAKKRESGNAYHVEIITLLKQEASTPTLTTKGFRNYVHKMCELALRNTIHLEDQAPKAGSK